VNAAFLVLAIASVITGMFMKYNKQVELKVSHVNNMIIEPSIQNTLVTDFDEGLSVPYN